MLSTYNESNDKVLVLILLQQQSVLQLQQWRLVDLSMGWLFES